MPINIRAGGTRKKSRPAPRTRSGSGTSSSRTIKRSATHGKSKQTKKTTTTETTGRRRRRTPQVSRAELKRILRQFEKLGQRREEHREEHKKAVREQGELVSQYYDVIPPSMIAEALGVSVQWLYTQQKQLENGGPKPPLGKGQSYRTGRLTTIKGRSSSSGKSSTTRKARKTGKATSRGRSTGRPRIRSRSK